jgi:lipopolysaccharide biosynthesis glycosyltransferase/GT2 family glycosyltransferase
MLVSVVIPVYNRKNFIRKCLESVLNQEFKGEYEVIVVDDGSTDGTVEIIKEFSSRVKLYLSPTNQGVSCARNQGVRLSQGKFVAMIDSDCIAYPDWLTELIKPFEQDKNIMIVGGRVTDIVSNNYWQMVNKGFSTFIANSNRYVDRVIGCNMAMRLEFVLSHLYDERLKFASGDDTGLCWMCQKMNFKVFYINSARVAHHHRSTVRASFFQQFLYGYMNTCLCIKFNRLPYIPYGPMLLLLLLLCLLLGFWGLKIAWVLATICSILFCYFCWFHSTKASVKTLYEAIITYPGNFLLYSTFCVGSLIYFFIPRAYLNPSGPICIGVASDDRYAPYLGVMLLSLLKNNQNERFDIFGMNAGISVENIDRFNALLKNFPNSKIRWLKCDTTLFNGFISDNYITLAAYYRIFLPQVIPESYDKCLYLDCDTLILGNIRPLWETDLENYALAAVQDAHVGLTDRAEVLGPFPSEKYFNSGVLLINLRLWRKEQLALKVIDFIRKNPSKIKLHDQDGLNGILYDSWKPLNERWNKMVFTIYGYGQTIKHPMKAMDFITGPKVMHFAYKNKPWLKESADPFRFFYFKYLCQTPWKYLIHQPNNFYGFLLQWCSRFIPLNIFILPVQTKGTFQRLMRAKGG